MSALRRIAVPLALCMHALWPPSAAGQEIRIEGGEGLDVVAAATDVLARRTHAVIRSDTTLPAGYHAVGDLVVVDSDLRLEGRIEGDVVLLGGTFFLRPSAEVGGTIYAVGGMVVASGQAAPVEVRETSGGVRVSLSTPAPDLVLVTVHRPVPGPRLVLPGVYGVNPFGFQYDRVNGVSLPWEVDWYPRRDEKRLRLTGRLTYRSQLGVVDPSIDAISRVGEWRFDGQVGRSTRTADGWAIGAFANTGSALLFGSDYRDYFRSDHIRVGASHLRGWVAGRTGITLTPQIDVEIARDWSVASGDPWTLFGSIERPNPQIDEGTVVSVRPTINTQWEASTVQFTGSFTGEVGTFEQGGGETARFERIEADVRWAMDAIADHRLAIHLHLRHPLGGEIPRQRWSILGGSPTLPTFAAGAFRGDRVEFVASRYDIPIDRVSLPLVGSPVLRLQHAAGMAWYSGGERPPWEQNLGVGVRLSILRVDAWTDPAEGSIAVSAGLVAPF